MRTPEQIKVAIDRLERMRFERTHVPPPQPGETLRPILEASAEWAALTVGIEALKAQLREAVS